MEQREIEDLDEQLKQEVITKDVHDHLVKGVIEKRKDRAGRKRFSKIIISKSSIQKVGADGG